MSSRARSSPPPRSGSTGSRRSSSTSYPCETTTKIGRASCRERVWTWGAAVPASGKGGRGGVQWRGGARAAVVRRFFFFSSRRRHTRSYGDWSSDVCSSDLGAASVRSRPSSRGCRGCRRGRALRRRRAPGQREAAAHHRPRIRARRRPRSEERRVGKECGRGEPRYQLAGREGEAGCSGAEVRVPRSSVASFFFQAEDGIRDRTVTGVQTCALPISARRAYGLAPLLEVVGDVVEGALFAAAALRVNGKPPLIIDLVSVRDDDQDRKSVV